MNRAVRNRLLLPFILLCASPVAGRADVPSFITHDPRLPNPDRPYDMQNGRVEFLEAHDMGLYDLKFQATNPRQVSGPILNMDGNWRFDSKYDIAYEAHVSFGLGPVHRVIGMGSAHVRGVAPDEMPLVFDTELVALDLEGLSSRPGEFLFRESPTLRSSGITTMEDACPACMSILPSFRISSFLDIFAEASPDGGQTWAPGDKPIHVVQQAQPVALGDYNQNGAVDAADYVLWRKKLGPGALANEGGVSNNLVDEADYKFWRSRFGAMVHPRPDAGSMVSSVPEPSTIFLLAIGALAALRARSRLHAR